MKHLHGFAWLKFMTSGKKYSLNFISNVGMRIMRLGIQILQKRISMKFAISIPSIHPQRHTITRTLLTSKEIMKQRLLGF